MLELSTPAPGKYKRGTTMARVRRRRRLIAANRVACVSFGKKLEDGEGAPVRRD